MSALDAMQKHAETGLSKKGPHHRIALAEMYSTPYSHFALDSRDQLPQNVVFGVRHSIYHGAGGGGATE